MKPKNSRVRQRAKFQRSTTVIEAVAAGLKRARKHDAYVAKYAKPDSRARRKEALKAERAERARKHGLWLSLYANQPVEKAAPAIEE